jgi:hypothetical protein
MPAIGAAWQGLSQQEREHWKKEANKLVRKRVTGFNVFTSLRVTGDS